MTEQLVFELATPDPPSFGNFLVGRNAEAIAALTALARGEAAETGIVLWGAPGSGKSHLLKALVDAAGARGAMAAYVAEPNDLLIESAEAIAESVVIAIDDLERATQDSQARMFSMFNLLRERGGHMVVATRKPLASIPFRDDLRTRLMWGLVYELLPLADAEKPAALSAYARQRGFPLTDDVIDYLLVHGRRDMSALLATLAALDRISLSTKRPITVAMLRDWLQRDIGLD